MPANRPNRPLTAAEMARLKAQRVEGPKKSMPRTGRKAKTAPRPDPAKAAKKKR